MGVKDIGRRRGRNPGKHSCMKCLHVAFSFFSLSPSLFLSLFWSDRAFVVYVGWRAVWYCGAARITVYWVVKYTYMHARA